MGQRVSEGNIEKKTHTHTQIIQRDRETQRQRDRGDAETDDGQTNRQTLTLGDDEDFHSCD